MNDEDNRQQRFRAVIDQVEDDDDDDDDDIELNKDLFKTSESSQSSFLTKVDFKDVQT